MTHIRSTVPVAALALLLPAATQPSPDQATGFDEQRVVLVYHHLTGEPLDLRQAAEQSDAARSATAFDRPDVVTAESARLQSLLVDADPAQEFVIRVNDAISQYDHEHGEFSIELFRPGFYVPVEAFGQQYRLVFANAEQARPIAMPKAEARDFDARLNQMGRTVTNEIRFVVSGTGDPAGAVTGSHVIRAQILAARLLDRDGRVVFTPTVTGPAVAGAAAPAAPFDAASADVAGFRVGVTVKDMDATLTRLFGPTERRGAGENAFAGYAGALVVNEMGCFSVPGRRHGGEPGAVCVTAFFDGDDVVRAVRIERVFPWFDSEVFRRTLVRKYGAVSAAENTGDLALGWGPPVDVATAYERAGPHTALSAYYVADDDFMSRGLNSLPRIRVVLQLVDAPWVAEQTSHSER